jgi:tetratricopeptide (TPR) repeat protein
MDYLYIRINIKSAAMIKPTLLSYLFFSLFISVASPAQNTDSIKSLLTKEKNDTSRMRLLNTLTELAPEGEWQEYNRQLLEISEAGMVKSAKNKALQLFYKKFVATALNNEGLNYQGQGNITKALECHQRATQLFTETGDDINAAYALNNLGFLYFNLGDIKRALDYQHRALKIQETSGNKFGIASALNFIAPIYEGQGETEKALEYYLRSLKINKEINNETGIALCNNNIGFIYKKTGKTQKALEHLREAAAIYKKTNNAEGYATSILNIGIIYMKNQDYTKGMDYFQEALKIQEAIGDKKGMATSLHNIAYIYYSKADYKNALPFSLREFGFTKELGYPRQMSDAAYLLKCIYQKQNNYKEALEMSDLYLFYRDSVNNEENRKATIKKQLQYVFEKKATADSVKTAEQQKVKDAEIKAGKARLAQEKTTRYALFGGLALVLVFSAFLYNRFRTIRQQKNIIESQKTEVERQKELVDHKQKEILDSIHYARRIQSALLTPERYIQKSLSKLK